MFFTEELTSCGKHKVEEQCHRFREITQQDFLYLHSSFYIVMYGNFGSCDLNNTHNDLFLNLS